MIKLLTFILVAVIFGLVLDLRRDVQTIKHQTCTHGESSIVVDGRGRITQPATLTGCRP